MGSVRNRDRHSVISYYRYLASIRKKGGFPLEELKNALLKLGDILISQLKDIPQLNNMHQYLNDQIKLTLEMAADEVDDAYSEIPSYSEVNEKEERFALSEEMTGFEKKIVGSVHEFLCSEENKTRFVNYRKKSGEELKWHITLIYKLLIGCVSHNDHASFISFIRYLSSIRKKEGFPRSELTDALCSTIKISIEEIKKVSRVERADEILDRSIKPNSDKISKVIKKVYAESVTF